MKRILAACLLLLSCFIACSYQESEITEYVVVKESGKKLRPVAKVVYKVFADRQEVIYWIERPNENRSQLYKLKHCIVVDAKNWEGYQDIGFSVPFSPKVEYINGRFTDANSVGWWTWHFETDPKPSNIALIGGSLFIVLWIIGIGISISDGLKKRREAKSKVA